MDFDTNGNIIGAISADLLIVLKDTQNRACRDDFCFICGRATDHWGEHSDKQLLDFAAR